MSPRKSGSGGFIPPGSGVKPLLPGTRKSPPLEGVSYMLSSRRQFPLSWVWREILVGAPTFSRRKLPPKPLPNVAAGFIPPACYLQAKLDVAAPATNPGHGHHIIPTAARNLSSRSIQEGSLTPLGMMMTPGRCTADVGAPTKFHCTKTSRHGPIFLIPCSSDFMPLPAAGKPAATSPRRPTPRNPRWW